jgi:hypothetical protein
MVTDHHGPARRIDQEAGGSQPLVLRLEQDGTGSASFDWAQVFDTLTSGFERCVDAALGRDTHVLGIRFVDADGRPVSGPVPLGVALVGFTTRPSTKETDQCISSDD